jgi:hypothetical protein
VDERSLFPQERVRGFERVGKVDRLRHARIVAEVCDTSKRTFLTRASVACAFRVARRAGRCPRARTSARAS